MATMPEVVKWLEGFVDGFDFQRPGVDQSLGRDVVNEICGGIAARSVTLRKGADAAWADLSDTPFHGRPGYRTWKREKYGIDNEPLSRTGQMLSMTSLRGKTEHQAKTIRIIYGTDAPPSSSSAPTGYMSKADAKATDTQKAQYAAEQGRKFFELDETIAEGVFSLIERNLIDYVLSA